MTLKGAPSDGSRSQEVLNIMAPSCCIPGKAIGNGFVVVGDEYGKLIMEDKHKGTPRASMRTAASTSGAGAGQSHLTISSRSRAATPALEMGRAA